MQRGRARGLERLRDDANHHTLRCLFPFFPSSPNSSFTHKSVFCPQKPSVFVLEQIFMCIFKEQTNPAQFNAGGLDTSTLPSTLCGNMSGFLSTVATDAVTGSERLQQQLPPWRLMAGGLFCVYFVFFFFFSASLRVMQGSRAGNWYDRLGFCSAPAVDTHV